MATKKGKRSTSSKKTTAKSETTKVARTTKDEAKVVKKAADEEPVVEEVVEVVEIEEPVIDNKKENKAKSTKPSISDKLAALNPAALIAELLGTFILTAAYIRFADNSYYGLIGVALVLIVNVIIFVKVSGAHMNPAITLAQWITRKINGVKAVAYIVAQVLGAVLAFFLLTGINNWSYDYEATVKKGVLSAGITEEVLEEAGGYDAWLETYGGLDSVASQLGITEDAPELYQLGTVTEGKELPALVAELLGSVIVGLGAAFAYNKRKDSKIAAGLAMGITYIAGLAIAGGTVVLNPAIASTLGVFSASNAQGIAWAIGIYVIGAVAGATLGFLVYNQMVKNEKINEEAIEC